jgi:hypothetical protein
MKQSINKSQFRDAFIACGRANQFSYEGLGLLFDWIEDFYADASSGAYELDVIALCCDFSELSLDEVLSQYEIIESDGDDSESELLGLVSDYLQDNTLLVGVTSDNKFIFQQF